jgi:hypothetical protein
MSTCVRFCRTSSEVLNESDSDFVDGRDVFAVKEKDVETGRKGQRGQ